MLFDLMFYMYMYFISLRLTYIYVLYVYSLGGGRGGEGGKSSSEMMMRFPPGASLDRQLEAAALGLGDLADITVANDEAENVTQFDIAGAADANTRKTWNAKYTLRRLVLCGRM